MNKFEKILPADATDYEKRMAKSSFKPLTLEQKSAFFYLLGKHQQTANSIPTIHVTYGLSQTAWIRIMIVLAQQMKETFAGSCCGNWESTTKRPSVSFIDKEGFFLNNCFFKF